VTTASAVRRATLADADALCRLYPLFLDSQFAMEPFARRNPDFDVRRYVVARLTDPAFTVFVAEVDGEVVGFSDCSVRPTQARPSLEMGGVRPFLRSLARRVLWTPPNSYVLPFVEGYLHNSFVHPDFRGHRLGFELSRVRVEELRARGAERIRVHTFAKNERAQRVFTSNGFRPMMLLMEWDAQAADPDDT
jgi:ribosomal protein S18 acetylase RimI-like enzyme